MFRRNVTAVAAACSSFYACTALTTENKSSWKNACLKCNNYSPQTSSFSGIPLYQHVAFCNAVTAAENQEPNTESVNGEVAETELDEKGDKRTRVGFKVQLTGLKNVNVLTKFMHI